jgi:hypothetical protein
MGHLEHESENMFWWKVAKNHQTTSPILTPPSISGRDVRTAQTPNLHALLPLGVARLAASASDAQWEMYPETRQLKGMSVPVQRGGGGSGTVCWWSGVGLYEESCGFS